MQLKTAWMTFVVGVGQLGRFLYEWADRKVEAGDHTVVRHARLRLDGIKDASRHERGWNSVEGLRDVE